MAAGRGRRKAAADNENGDAHDQEELEQPELEGMPERIWPNYDGQPVDRVDLAFGGFSVKDAAVAAALQQYGKELVLTIKGRVITHGYKSKFDRDFGDSRSAVTVTFLPTEMAIGGRPVLVIEGESSEDDTP